MSLYSHTMNTPKNQEDCFDSNFTIKFDGENHQIDANVLINFLLHTSTIIQEINKRTDSDRKIEIKINALERGSFLVHIELAETVVESLKNLFNGGYVGHASGIISAVVGLIQLKQFLQGKKPKSIEKEKDTTTVVNENGQVFITNNFYYNLSENSPVIQDALSNGFENLANDPSISGLEILNKYQKTFARVNRDEFPAMSTKPDEILPGERITYERAILSIFRPSFEENLKWDFNFKGNRISAKMLDMEFQESINNGAPFHKGDSLEVHLEITQKWNDLTNNYINKYYQIVKILQHIPRKEYQTNLV